VSFFSRRDVYNIERRRTEGNVRGMTGAAEILRDSIKMQTPEDMAELQRLGEKMKQDSVQVDLPRHIYIPKGVPSLDLRRACFIPAGSSNYLLWEFTCRPGTVAIFTHYALYCDAQDAALVEFKPTVDGNRIFPYHGDPSNNYKMNLGLAPDLSEISLIQANLILFPGQTIRWKIDNLDTVDVAMGTRMVGYLDAAAAMTSSTFGS
jgi:hypothetical protein